jgi:hypothetical protein
MINSSELGVNSTEVTVIFVPGTLRERAVMMVTVRPGNFPTEEANMALSFFYKAVKDLQGLGVSNHYFPGSSA